MQPSERERRRGVGVRDRGIRSRVRESIAPLSDVTRYIAHSFAIASAIGRRQSRSACKKGRRGKRENRENPPVFSPGRAAAVAASHGKVASSRYNRHRGHVGKKKNKTARIFAVCVSRVRGRERTGSGELRRQNRRLSENFGFG